MASMLQLSLRGLSSLQANAFFSSSSSLKKHIPRSRTLSPQRTRRASASARALSVRYAVASAFSKATACGVRFDATELPGGWTVYTFPEDEGVLASPPPEAAPTPETVPEVAPPAPALDIPEISEGPEAPAEALEEPVRAPAVAAAGLGNAEEEAAHLPGLELRKPSAFAKASPVAAAKTPETATSALPSGLPATGARSRGSSPLRPASALQRQAAPAVMVGAGRRERKGAVRAVAQAAAEAPALGAPDVMREPYLRAPAPREGSQDELDKVVARLSRSLSAPPAAGSHTLPARPPSAFVKRSPVADAVARSSVGHTSSITLLAPALTRGSGAVAEAAAKVELPARLPSHFEKTSPVLAFRLRKAETGDNQEQTSRDEETEAEADGISPLPVAAAASVPERHPSSFQRRRRRLPSKSKEDIMAASQLPIQPQPNGTPIYNRIPRAIPLGGVPTPALMEEWGTAEAAADMALVQPAAVPGAAAGAPAETLSPESSGSALTAPAPEPQLASVKIFEVEATAEVAVAATPARKRRGSSRKRSSTNNGDAAAPASGASAATAALEQLSASSSAEEELSSLTVAELRAAAKAAGLKGYSKLKKAELIQRLQEIRT